MSDRSLTVERALARARNWANEAADDELDAATVGALLHELDQQRIRAEAAEAELDEWEGMRNEWRDKAFAHFDEAERQRARAEAAEAELEAYRAAERRAS